MTHTTLLPLHRCLPPTAMVASSSAVAAWSALVSRRTRRTKSDARSSSWAPSTTTLCYLLALLAFARTSSASEWSPGCEAWPSGFPAEHHETSCDAPSQRQSDKYGRVVSFEVASSLPEERTWFCPPDDGSVASALAHGVDQEMVGHRTRWVVRNEADSPIVLSWVRPDSGEEVSAANADVPPGFDDAEWPKGSVLSPTMVAVVEVYEGHVFQAREWVEEEGGGGKKAGRVLLRHRAGPIYVKNEYGAVCPDVGVVADVEPPEEERMERAPEDPNRDCNVLFKGFLNKVGCPVDLYFATGNEIIETPLTYEKGGPRPKCERFSAHLGIGKSPQNYFDDYASPIKYEGVYNTHRFVARTTHDNSLAAEIYIDADVVRNCPDGRAAVRKFVQVASEEEEVYGVVFAAEVTPKASISLVNGTSIVASAITESAWANGTKAGFLVPAGRNIGGTGRKGSAIATGTDS